MYGNLSVARACVRLRDIVFQLLCFLMFFRVMFQCVVLLWGYVLGMGVLSYYSMDIVL